MTIRALPSARTLQPGLLAFTTNWKYSGGKRDLRLDLLRGFAALAMVVDHVGGEQSWLYWVTGGGKLWVSAAELFVLIAGLTMGIVYGAMATKLGIGPAVKKALGRAWRMYLVMVALTFSFVALSIVLGLPWAPALTWATLPVWALQVATLQRTFFLVDIPFMYTVLIALAAPVLLALWKGWTLPLLAASWALWAIWQVAPGTVELPWRVADNSMFHLAAWQVIFVHGVVVGFHREALLRVVRTSAFEVLLASATVLAMVGAMWATEQHDGGLLQSGSFLLNQLYDKANVPFGRLVMLAVSFTFLYSLITVAWQPISGILS
ncbi:MAG: OpgC domain-containing protein, partial [Chloroflexota bacterium]